MQPSAVAARRVEGFLEEGTFHRDPEGKPNERAEMTRARGRNPSLGSTDNCGHSPGTGCPPREELGEHGLGRAGL